MPQPRLYHGGLLTQPIFHQNDGLYHGVMGTCGSQGDTALARPRPTIHLDTNWSTDLRSPSILQPSSGGPALVNRWFSEAQTTNKANMCGLDSQEVHISPLQASLFYLIQKEPD
jgi:hypothetical protein